jgi:hypothetical protein
VQRLSENSARALPALRFSKNSRRILVLDLKQPLFDTMYQTTVAVEQRIIKGTLLRSVNHLSFLLVGVCLRRGNLDFSGSRVYESPKGAFKTSSMSDLLGPLRGQIGSLRDQIYCPAPVGRGGIMCCMRTYAAVRLQAEIRSCSAWNRR